MIPFFLLAAGFGKRMGSWTEKLPKPMLSVDGVRFLDYSFYLLYKWDFTQGFINLHYKADVLQSHLSSQGYFDLNLSVESPEILGTAGGIRTALERFGKKSHLLLYNPDTLLFPNKDFLPKQSLPSGSLCHLYLSPKPKDAKYTGISLAKDGFVEFQNGEYFYIGLALLDTSVLDFLPSNTYSDLSDVFRKLASEGKLTGELFLGTTLDLGEKHLYEEWKDKPIFGSEKEQIVRFIEHNLFPNEKAKI